MNAGGERVPGQPCLSNPDVLELVKAGIARWIDEYPRAKYFSVSQNDNWDYCRCPQCASVDAAEGSPSGSMITFVNKVAAYAKTLNPGVFIHTFAYQYTVTPPKNARPADNVVVQLCSIGLCHGIFGAGDSIAKIMGLGPGEIEVTGAGLNHFQWILGIRRREDNADLYPLLREKGAAYDPGCMPLTRKLFRAFGYWPTCSDGHLGEYLPYGCEAGMQGYDFEADEAMRKQRKKDIADVVEGRADISGWFRRSGEKAIDIIKALHTGKRAYIPSAIVYNQGAIENLPGDLAVEIPVVVDGGGIVKTHVGKMPPGAAALMSLQIGAQQMSVEAAVKGDKQMALQALLVDPVINGTEAAVKILDELWEINRPYIRAFRR